MSALVLLVTHLALASAFLTHNKVCYKPLGCFETDEPFDNALGETPDSPEDIQVKTYLWTKSNPVVPQILDPNNPDSIRDSNFDPGRPTKILIHGFMSSKDASPIVANLSVAFLNKADLNVVGVDWSRGAHQFYPKAVANTRLVGAVVAGLVQTLVDKAGLKLADLHVLGHSLGAHTAGYVGRRVPGIARITGLDPAGPMFTGTDAQVRLDPTDALFVDVIHSDAAPLEDAGFGTLQSMGHQDFYPNGGQNQPGCPPPVRTSLEDLITMKFSAAFASVACAHDRAIWYFIESVTSSQCQFVARPCNNWESYTDGSCTACGPTPCPVMGIHSIQSQARGSFYLRTGADRPFCSKHGTVK